MDKKTKIWILVFVLVILVVGSFYVIDQTPFWECAWSGTGRAWIDTNQNGVWDEGEDPLPGVMFSVDDVRNGDEKVITAQGGENGAVKLVIELKQCPSVAYAVYVEVPQGYRLTTPERLVDERMTNDAEFLFGFVPVE
ncbi:MAG: hypothetical protein JXB38_06660 [Anaerolineales bacterium]|nr:hypothetical protein [Anaerolineales bacterium]